MPRVAGQDTEVAIVGSDLQGDGVCMSCVREKDFVCRHSSVLI